MMSTDRRIAAHPPTAPSLLSSRDVDRTQGRTRKHHRNAKPALPGVTDCQAEGTTALALPPRLIAASQPRPPFHRLLGSAKANQLRNRVVEG